MTTSLLTLQGVAFTWPNGHQLFSGIDFRLDHRPTGLVGRNGAGKSVLARLTAGLLKPTRGHCRHAGSIHYVPQHAAWPPGTTVAAAVGVQTVLDALARIEAGQVEAADFEAVGGCWNIRQRLADGLEADGLGHLAPERSVAGLSGGELTRLALLGAWLSDPDILILDEPTNHLDRPQRMRLLQQLAAWQKGLLVISHDRELLENMQRTVELSPTGLRDYDGGFAFYAQARAQERERAEQALEHSKAEQRRGEAAWRAR